MSNSGFCQIVVRNPISTTKPPLSVEGMKLSSRERELAAVYLDAGAPVDRAVIESNIEENINALGGVARIDVLVEAIQSVPSTDSH